MNRIWFGVGLLILLLALGFCSSSFLERTCLDQTADLEQAAKLALEGNWSGAESFADAAHRQWNKNRALFAALSDHAPMDQAEGLFAQLEVFAAARDALSYSSTCVYLARQLEALGKSHSFNLPNLF